MSDGSEEPRKSEVGNATEQVRARVTRGLYQALARDAAAHGVSLAERVRSILEGYYDGYAEPRDHPAVVQERIEKRLDLLTSMLDLHYLGTAMRLPKPPEEEREVRVADAREAREKWAQAAVKLAGEGGPPWLKDLLGDEADLSGEPS